jgi:polysaccharide export outer membrane protein
MPLTRSRQCLLYFLLLSPLLPSCVNTKKTVYFNNIQDTILTERVLNAEPVIRQSDVLNITVSSLNPEASVIFNTPNLVSAISSTNVASGGGSIPGTVGAGQYTGYLVNADGNIKYPVIGDIKVAGLTKKQLEEQIVQLLTDKKLLVDPIVSVRFLNFRVTVLGEVNKPTTINVVNEHISILEALGLAGDLTIYGKRDNVLLIREDGRKKIIHRIDLNSEEILTSPFYYLQTNDVVYVEPNKSKIASTSRTQQLLPIIIAGLGFIAIIVTYSIKN